MNFLKLQILFLFFSSEVFAAFANYSSPLLGDRFSGMAGAATALAEDASASSFYNPAGLVRIEGESLAGSVSTYQKADTAYGSVSDFTSASLRVNQGYFRAISAASGYIQKVKNYFLGLSLVVPDFDSFQGDIAADDANRSQMNFNDESLWVGASAAKKIDEENYVGITVYYTARNFSRSTRETSFPSTSNATLTFEDLTLKANSFLAILGYQYKPLGKWTYGISVRTPSLHVNGQGSYSYTRIETNPYSASTENRSDFNAITPIPPKLSFGLSYETESQSTISVDLTIHGGLQYYDLGEDTYSTLIRHKPTYNGAVGIEVPMSSWLKVRTGVYTNFSSHPSPDESLNKRQGDHVDQYGFSANLAARTNKNTVYTFGGFYSGGSGSSLQKIKDNLKITTRSQQLFTMLVGFSYGF